MRTIGKIIVAVLAVYGARFAFREILWIFKNPEVARKAYNEGRIPMSDIPRWSFNKK